MTDVIFANLPDSPDVETVVLGQDGVIEAARSGQVFVDNSTIRPSVARTIAARLSEKGVQALDAPVSGGDIGARDATLTIMVGAMRVRWQKVMPVFKAMGKTVTHVGDGGSGTSRQGCEPDHGGGADGCDGRAARFFAEGGSRSRKVVDAIKGGAAQCWALDVKPQRLFAGNRNPGFKAYMQAKDMNIVLETAREYGVPLPSTAHKHPAVPGHAADEHGGSRQLGGHRRDRSPGGARLRED